MKSKIRNIVTILIVSILMIFSISGCTNNSNKREINIAIQMGTAYAPLEIMKELELLEKRLDGVSVNWIQVDGPTAIREGILSGDIDIGFMGPAPFLVGFDNNMDWKIISGLSFNEVAIVTDKEYVQQLSDFRQEDRIAILSPACTQHVLLAMACEQEFGDPNYFESQLVSMSHPDAMNALIAETEISAHIATPPYIGTELSNGMHIVMTGEEIIGKPFTFIIGATTQQFYDEEQDLYLAFLSALEESINYINSDINNAAQMLAPVYGIDEEELLSQMTYNGSIYSMELEGIEQFAEAMYRMGFTKNKPVFEDIVFPNALED